MSNAKDALNNQITFINVELNKLQEKLKSLEPGSKEYMEVSKAYNDKSGQLNKFILTKSAVEKDERLVELQEMKNDRDSEIQQLQLIESKKTRLSNTVMQGLNATLHAFQLGAIVNREKFESVTTKVWQCVDKTFDPKKYRV